MNKTELVAAMAEKTGLSKKDAESALKAFIDTVTDELKADGKVQTNTIESGTSAECHIPGRSAWRSLTEKEDAVRKIYGKAI